MKWLNDITEFIDMSLSKLKEIVKDREAWFAVVHWVAKNWKDLATSLPLFTFMHWRRKW